MTERFIYDDGIWDNNVEDMADALLTNKEIVDNLNSLYKENQKLKEYVENLVNADAYWEKKARQKINALTEENQRLVKMLDNLANYMQKEHRDISIDDFVEWWNNIATEGLEVLDDQR